MKLEVFEATNGEEALTLARQCNPDVAFLDVQMPKLNGYQVCRELRQNPETRDIKIVIRTSLSDEFSREKALKDVKADRYISKPFSPVVLLEGLQELLSQ